MVDWDRNTAWRQGHLLSDDAVDALGLRDPSISDQVVVVATHDCDLTQSPINEPFVEVIVGRLIEKLDGNFTHAKNARKLHVKFGDELGFAVELIATKKVPTVDKWKLNRYKPRNDAVLTSDNKNIFQLWLASRYRRSAFPDEFETRLKESRLHDAIARILRPLNNEITGIFFDVDNGAEIDRVGDDDTYTLNITLLHSAVPDLIAAEKAAGIAQKAIEKVFKEKLFDPTNQWKCVELQSCDVYSESVLTYEIFKGLKRWRLDHFSLVSDPQQEVPD